MPNPTNRTAPPSNARLIYPSGPPQNRPAGGPASMPPRGQQPSLPPWTNSAMLQGFFVYVPSTDEIFMRDGRRLPRPPQMQLAQLANSTYTGPLPPPTQLPQYPFVNTGSPPTSSMQLHPGSPPGIASAMGNMNLNRKPQEITPEVPVNVFFNHGGSASAIQRGDPPNNNIPSVKIDNPELTKTLFPEYKVRLKPRDYFKIGKVFLVLWSEPAGGTSKVTAWEKGTVLNQLGERVFSKVRRFVVIREGGTYCNALPINTYGGKGVSKRSANKSEHVIIFSGSAPPRPTALEMPQRRGEAPMQLTAIQVDMDRKGEGLDPMSRLDLGGVTKVEHNIKVKSLGNVNKHSVDALRKQYANVQNSSGGAGPSNTPAAYALHAQSQQGADEEDDDDDDDEDDEDESDDGENEDE